MKSMYSKVKSTLAYLDKRLIPQHDHDYIRIIGWLLGTIATGLVVFLWFYIPH